MGRQIRVEHKKWRPGDQKAYISNISKIKERLGWTPKIGVEEGIYRLYEWMEENISLFA